MNDDRNLCVTAVDKAEVRRYRIGSRNQQVVYVADKNKHRLMKWTKCGTKGIIVAGKERAGSSLAELRDPHGLFLDASAILYIADDLNQRVIRWPEGVEVGIVVVSGSGRGEGTNQFKGLAGLCIDRSGHFYVADRFLRLWL